MRSWQFHKGISLKGATVNFVKKKILLFQVIRLYTECLSGNFQMSSEQRSILYGNRSITYLLNRQQGDYYAALRDSIEVCFVLPFSKRRLFPESYSEPELFEKLLENDEGARRTASVQAGRRMCGPLQKTLSRQSGPSYIGKSCQFLRVVGERVIDIQLNEANAKKEDNQDGYEDLRSVTQPMQDYEARFTGHRNNQTDIKEANFFGSHNQYISKF